MNILFSHKSHAFWQIFFTSFENKIISGFFFSSLLFSTLNFNFSLNLFWIIIWRRVTKASQPLTQSRNNFLKIFSSNLPVCLFVLLFYYFLFRSLFYSAIKSLCFKFQSPPLTPNTFLLSKAMTF